MTPELIESWATLIVAITGFIVLFVRQEKTKRAVTNDHREHLRDDMDYKHNRVIGKIDALGARFDKLESREVALLERIGAHEEVVAKEHQNMWKAIANLRNRRK